MNLQGNLTVYDFYKALRILSDGWQLTKLPVSTSLLFHINHTQTYFRTANTRFR